MNSIICKPCFGVSIFKSVYQYSAIQNYYALQGIHTNCPETSSCHAAIYSPSKVLLTDPKAEAALLQHLTATYIYREAEYFCRVSLNVLSIIMADIGISMHH